MTDIFEPLLKDKENVSSVVTIACALIPSPALLLFIARPDLFERLDTVQLILILSALGFAVLIVCMFALVLVRETGEARRRHVQLRDGLVPPPREPVKEWPAFSMVAGFANMFFLLVSVWAYWHRIRLGATLALAATLVLAGALIMCAFNTYWPLNWTDPTLEQRQRAAELFAEGRKAQGKKK